MNNLESPVSDAKPDQVSAPTTYTTDELNQMHKEALRHLASAYKCHMAKVKSEGKYFVRVSNRGASLVTRYRVRDENGLSGVCEYNVAL